MRTTVALLLLLPAVALAAPAELVVIVDTSASMAEPAPGGGESRLAVAKRVVGRIADAAAERGHRVGLFRYRQLTKVVESGEGAALAVAEHPHQCEEMADLLVPPEVSSVHALRLWTNGAKAQGDPELEAVGDSPLYGAVRVGLRFVRALRQLEPAKRCVNAALLVITDGRDTCAAGGELQTALAELRAQGVAEDIRAFVLAADPDTEAAQLVADIGHDDPQVSRPYGFDEEDAFVAAVAAIEGRIAPAACVASGVAAEEMKTPGGGAKEPDEPAEEDEQEGGSDDGCRAGGGGLPLPLAVLLGALLWRRRALALLVALLALGACSDEPGAEADAGADAIVGVVTLPEPDDTVAEAIAEANTVIDAAQAALTQLAPLVDPASAFEAAGGGDPLDGCRALVQQVAFEPYQSAQRGPRGCLGTLRCNAIDQALLLQACLQHHGVASTLHQCTTDEAARGALRAAAAEPVAPSFEAARATVAAPYEAALAKLQATDFTRLLAEASSALYRRDIEATVKADVDGLLPLLGVDAAQAEAHVEAALEAALAVHYVVDVGGERWVPVLPDEAGLSCGAKAFDWHDDAAEGRLELLVQYAELYDGGGGNLPSPFEVLEVTWRTADQWGTPVSFAITEAGQDPPALGLPAPAAGDCFVPHARVGEWTVGQPFALLTAGAADCTEPPVTTKANLVLVRLVLRTAARLGSPNGSQPWHAHDRMLVDRWGYAQDVPAAIASGGQYTLDAMRSMVPLRADVRVGGGRPTLAHHYAALLRHVVDSRDATHHAIRRLYGVGAQEPDPPRPMPPVHSATMAWVTDQAPRWLDGRATFAQRPWRTVTLRRRGYGPVEAGPLSAGLGFSEQTIFDVVDLADAVFAPDGGDPAGRLAANVALGALVTEAERLAIGVHEQTLFVVNAGDMFRHGGPAWAVWDADQSGDGLPLAVREAAEQILDAGEQLVTSPGPVTAQDGNAYIGWWRVAETGFALGEIRYDGTFYGGGAASAIGNFAHCLAFQAIQALTCHARVIPNIDCCRVQVLLALLFGLVPHGGEVLMGLQGAGVLPTYGDPPWWLVNIRDGLLKDIEMVTQAQTFVSGTDPGENPLAAALTIAQTAAEAWDAGQTVQKAPPCMVYVVDNQTVVGGECPEP